ncbi:MAG: PD-(D/E)XK nuclease family protein [Thermoleophilia bacterium]|nr:PD-(D/E)XK nuclease family protein [Thermoleophilia bacterium]
MDGQQLDIEDATTRPGVTLVLGPPNAGKLGWVVEWWRRHRGADPLVVVPTRPDVTAVTLELVERSGPVVGRPPVSTFEHLVRGITREAAPAVGDLERMLILEDVLSSQPLESLAGMAALPGTVPAIAEVFQELTDGDLGAEEVSAGLQAWERDGGGALARDVRALFRAYRRALDTLGVGERADAIRLAAATVRSAAHLSGIGKVPGGSDGGLPAPLQDVAWARPVACYGFTSFTPGQRRLLVELAKVMPVVIALTADPDPVRGRSSAVELSFWRGRAARVVELRRQAMAFSSPVLARLERCFLSETVPEPEEGDSTLTLSQGDTGVRMLVSSGRMNEAESVGGEIVRLLRDGYRPDDMAVLARQVDPWQRVLRQVFRAYGIPHRIDGRLAWGETGLGHAVLQACRGVLLQERDAFLAYLRSPYAPGSRAQADDLELHLRQRGVTGGPDLTTAVNTVLPEALAEVAAVFSTADERRPLRLDALLELAVQMVARATRGRHVHDWRLEDDAQALTTLARGLGQIDRVSGRLAPLSSSRERIAARVLALLQGLAVRTGRGDERGVVHVLSVPRARARRFPIVFVLGLVDGEFPAAERRPALLSAAHRGRANATAGASLFPEPVAGEDVALFSLALSRPWQLLYLSSRDAEDDGEERPVSPFVHEVERVLAEVPVVRRKGLQDVTHEPGQAPSRREYVRACVDRKLLPPDAELAARVRGTVRWHCDPHRLCGPEASSRLAGQRVFAATELEDYARCPYAWFVKRLLRPRDLEPILTGLQRGILAHQVLKDTYTTLRASRALPLRPSSLPCALEAASRALALHVPRLPAGGSPAERRLMGWQVLRLVEAFLHFDAHSGSLLTPSEFECSLPAEGVDVGGVVVKGRMDRVDRGPGGAPVFIVDYKVGSRVDGPDFAATGALQVPLYMAALRRLHPELPIAGGAYVALGSQDRKGMMAADHAGLLGAWLSPRSARDAEDFGAEVDACVRAAAHAAEGIRRGDIPAAPAWECPSYCDNRPLCRSKEKAFTP